MKQTFYVLLSTVIIFFTSCNSKQNKNGSLLPSNDDVSAAKKSSNAITQSLPTLMVIPSDALLKDLDCISEIDNQGVTSFQRDYNKAFVNDKDLKFVIATIEGEFANSGYPLENLEQKLKMISTENAMDNATGVKKDLKAQLLNTARPDCIIEVEYELKNDTKSRNINKYLTYYVKCIDAYSNKAISSVTRTDVGIKDDSNELASLIKEDFPSAISEIQGNLKTHYADILANGVEISLRITTDLNSDIALDDYCGEEEIGEQIINWLKKNTINSTYKLSVNSKSEMRFANVRIYTQDEKGQSYGAYDFAKDLKKALRKGCGLDISNQTQSIGDAYLHIEGNK